MKTKIILATILAALLSACATTQCDKCCKQKKEIMLQMYSLRDDLKKDYDGTVKEMAKMGYTGVEASGFDTKTMLFFGKTPEAFKKEMQDLGMKVLSSHTRRTLTPQEIESGDFSAALETWKKIIDAHKRAGCKFIVDPYEKFTTKKEIEAYAKYFNEIGKLCKAQGLAFGYHNHAHEFEKVDGALVLDQLIQKTDPELVFFQMDVYWVVIGKQSPVEYFKKYPNRFRLLHIKDLKELGRSGMVGFDAIFNNLPKSVEGYFVEIERYDFPPKTSVKMAYDYLNQNSFVPASLPVK